MALASSGHEKKDEMLENLKRHRPWLDLYWTTASLEWSPDLGFTLYKNLVHLYKAD